MSPPAPPRRRRRRRRLLALTGLALVGAVGAWALYLFQWRHALPPAPPHTRVRPPLDALPSGLRACWLETARLLDNTASGLLVRHPVKGDLLVDAGNSSRFAEEISVYRKTKWLWMRAVPGALAPSRSIAEALTAVGADPARVLLLPTHAHLDHVGGLVDLPPSTAVLLAPAEIAWVNGARGRMVEGLIPAHVARLDGHMTPIDFARQPYEIFDESADLFGDGSVVVVPLAGHTPGSVGVFVNLSPSLRLFHVGDAVHDWRGLERALSEPPLLAGTNQDPAASERVVATLAQLHRDAPELAFVPAHARRAWRAAFPDGPGACVSAPPAPAVAAPPASR